jgi:hypothetical protein
MTILTAIQFICSPEKYFYTYLQFYDYGSTIKHKRFCEANLTRYESDWQERLTFLPVDKIFTAVT